MVDRDEELVRIHVVRDGHRSSVSMDMYLASVLKQQLGGDTAFKLWVQATVDEIARQTQDNAHDAHIGQRIRARSGLSRLVQREAIRRVVCARDGH